MKKKILVSIIVLLIMVVSWPIISKATVTSSWPASTIKSNVGKTNVTETTLSVYTTDMTSAWADEDVTGPKFYNEVKKDNKFGVSSLTLNGNAFCIEVGANWTKNMKLTYFEKKEESNTAKSYILAHEKKKDSKFVWDTKYAKDSEKILHALWGHYNSPSQAALWLICGQNPNSSHLTKTALENGYKLYGDAITFADYRKGYKKISWIATSPKVETQSDGNFAVGPYKINYTSKINNGSKLNNYEIATGKMFGGITNIEVWADTQTTSNKKLTMRNGLLD